MRMFAYHPCETPLVERTTGALEAHSLPLGVDYGLFDAGCARARAQFSLRCSRSTISGWLSRHGGVP
jgi:hypothetical protein